MVLEGDNMASIMFWSYTPFINNGMTNRRYDFGEDDEGTDGQLRSSAMESYLRSQSFHACFFKSYVGFLGNME